MRLVWVTRGVHQEADFMVGRLFSAKLMVARDGSWSVIGEEGRKTGAKAASVGHAKQAALTALKEVLEAGIAEIDGAMKEC